MKILVLTLISILTFPSFSYSQNQPEAKPYTIRVMAEAGFLGVMSHKIQFSNTGTYFDYKNDGGQDVLFPFKRFSFEVDFNEKNTFTFLYQPLKIETQVLLDAPLIVDNFIFLPGTRVDLLYNFPFYRVSYLRTLKMSNEKYQFALGGTLQIRNTTISFESTSSFAFRTNRNVGLVPALKLKTKAKINDWLYAELEADGIYAPVSYLNGSNTEIVGAILDASLRSGFYLKENTTGFINFRYLGGGAVGTSANIQGPGDGYVRNWLHFLTVSSGLIYSF